MEIAGSCDCVQYTAQKHKLHWGADARASWQPWTARHTALHEAKAAETGRVQASACTLNSGYLTSGSAACTVVSNTAKDACWWAI